MAEVLRIGSQIIKANKMKTSVEWLLSELHIRLLKIKSEPDGIVRETIINNFLIDTEQAKEIEKQQIIDAYEDGNYDNGMGRCEAEQYYNETYKSK